MKIIITGAGGFVGSKLADALLGPESPIKVTSLLLTDYTAPANRSDPRVRTLALDITSHNAAKKLLSEGCDIFFHLAAVVSGHAEAELETGYHVNLDATRALLDAIRVTNPRIRFVFSSTSAVFGGELPSTVTDHTRTTPQGSYGTQKAMCELLLNDYTRRGLVDGIAVRLPAVCVRSGPMNRAVTTFASMLVRDPLDGKDFVCPVPPEQNMRITSPGTVVKNLMHAATLPSEDIAKGGWRVVTLPGIIVSVADKVEALKRVAGERVAARVRFERDQSIAGLVVPFPKAFDYTRAFSLGFSVDKSFDDVIRAYIREELKGKYVE